MTAPRRLEMFKSGYEGDRPSGQLTPLESDAYARFYEPLVKRLHTAMLTLGALTSDRQSRSSSMPEYLHTFADKVGWDQQEDLPSLRFQPSAADLDDFLPTVQLLEGLSPVFLKVLALRAVGERVGGFSFKTIAERFGKGEPWAKRVYSAVVVLASRRAGLLDPAPKGWAVVVVAVKVGGWRTYLTSARDPQQALYDLRAKSPVELEAAFALWTAGKPEAAALVAAARKNLLGRVSHGSWHLLSPEDMADQLIEEQTRVARPWELEPLNLPTATRTARAAGRMMAAAAGGGDQ